MATDTPMQLGMVGLGRMGAGIVRRLLKDGHECVGYDVSADAVQAVEADGAVGSTSLEETAARLDTPRAVWVMVPAGAITDSTIAALSGGARARRRDHRRRQHALRRGHPARSRAREQGIHLVDVGTSGGVWGFERGFCLMIGGEQEVVARLSPLFASIAPGSTRRRGRRGAPGSRARPSTVTSTAGRPAPATS